MTATEQETIGGVWAGLLEDQVRGSGGDFIHLIPQHGAITEIADTKASVRTHFVARGANGEVAYRMLAEQMALAIVDYCIPRQQILAARAELASTGSTSAILRLRQRAAALFVDADGTGEGGELLLYMLTEQILGYPQVLAKMALKTSSNMHYHGSDGVHARFSDGDILDLFWGESKFYKDASSAFSDCFASISPFLLSDTDGSERLNDLMLLNSHVDPGHAELACKLVRYFDSRNKEALELRWNGVCLIGFDVDEYPDAKDLSDEAQKRMVDAVAAWHKAVKHRVAKHKLEAVSIDIFCIPFPSVDDMRKAVRAALEAS